MGFGGVDKLGGSYRVGWCKDQPIGGDLDGPALEKQAENAPYITVAAAEVQGGLT